MVFWISIGIGLVMAVLLLRLFFGTVPDMLEALYRPSAATLKLVIGVALAVVMGFSAYYKLPKHFPKLAQLPDANATNAVSTDAKSVVQARTSQSPTNSVQSLSVVPTLNGVKLGDTIQISAIHPPIALRSATVTSMDQTQLTVIATSGSYTILWKDVTGLKVATPPATKGAAK